MIAIDHLREVRKLVERVVNSVSEEELFEIPPGFSNNIAWNAAHLVVTQQLLQYGLSQLDFLVPKDLIETYRKGTQPEKSSSATFYRAMEFLHKAPEQLQEDYEKGLFTSFTTYETSTGIVLHNIDEAIAFNNMHEGIHLGYMMALRKSLKKVRS